MHSSRYLSPTIHAMHALEYPTDAFIQAVSMPPNIETLNLGTGAFIQAVFVPPNIEPLGPKP
jgi:hypothetical protein